MNPDDLDPVAAFHRERQQRLNDYRGDASFQALSQQWLEASMRRKYVYNFDWLGRPIIQYPQDMVAVQEVIWRTRPDLIIETGIAHGGSLILSASMLAMLDMCDAIEHGVSFDPRQSKRLVLGLDIDIRPHNRAAIEAHPMASRIRMLQGSSIDSAIVEQVRKVAKGFGRVMLCLDSNHTHEHVKGELEAYASLVTPDCYCMVFDTFVENMPDDLFPDRPWSPGDNPMTAVRKYLEEHPEFEVDHELEAALQVSVAPQGLLRRLAMR